VAGAPQLGAGAALGTTAGAVGTLAVGGGAAMGASRVIGGGAMGALRAGTAMSAAASTAYKLGQETSGSPTIAAGLGGVARATGAAARDRAEDIGGLGAAAERGRRAAFDAGASGGESGSGAAPAEAAAPQWARRLRAEQAARHHRQVAVQALREGDRAGAAATPDIKEKED
jgi:type IV secretion system protein TrbL